MEQTNVLNLRGLPLERLVSEALVELERLGYSRRSRNRYRAIWEHLIEYSERNKLGNAFSRDLAMRFLEEHRATIWEDQKASSRSSIHVELGIVNLDSGELNFLS